MTVFDDNGYFHIYKHHDGYPEAIKPMIEEAKQLAWDLHRFEAGEFPASLEKAMKTSKWGVYLTSDAELHADRAYHYDIYTSQGYLMVEIYNYQWSQERI